jgi:hypothetical protein
MLFNKKSNALGLALMLETHLSALIKELGNIYKDGSPIPSAGRLKALFNSSGDGSKSLDAISSVISFVSKLEKECCVCKSLEYTMARYIEVIFHLWKTEPDFKKLYSAQSGFCLPHLRLMLQNSGKYLSSRERDEFLQETMKMQMENLGRIRDEVHWFTQKFDYRYKDEPWGNSKDAVQRAVQKLAGYMKLDG